MKSIAEIDKIKCEMQEKLHTRTPESDNDIRIIVGMGTCGIASGANFIVNAFINELAFNKVMNAKVTQSGCVGLCEKEPMAQVIFPNKDAVTYVNLDEVKVKQIVSEHIINGKAVSEFQLSK